MFKKIAVALDGSHCAEHAFEVALRLAESEHAELGICSVVDPVMIAGLLRESPVPVIVVRERARTPAASDEPVSV
jgi:nucleotide-binding universal stress UspA family protein